MRIELVRFRGQDGVFTGKVQDKGEDGENVLHTAFPVGKKARGIESGEVWLCEVRDPHPDQCSCDVKPLKLVDLSSLKVFILGKNESTRKTQWEHTMVLTDLTSVVLVLDKNQQPKDGTRGGVRIHPTPEMPLACKRQGDKRTFFLLVKDKKSVSKRQQTKKKVSV